MDRRRFLIAGVAVSAALAGCSESGPSDGDGTDDESEPDDEQTDEKDDGNETGSNESESSETENRTDADEQENTENETDEGGETDDDGANGDENETDEPDESDDTENETDEPDESENDTVEEDETDQDGTDEDESGEGGNETDEGGEEDETQTYVLDVEVYSQSLDRLADATVTVGEETARTDDDGVATFELEAETYTVEATGEPYVSAEKEVSLDGDETVTFRLERDYEGIEIVEHDVEIARRDESDDTIDAAVVVENRRDHETESMWVEVSVYDDEGEELGHAMSRNFSVAANGREEGTVVVVDRSEYEDYPDELTIGSYEIVLDSIESRGSIDEVSQGMESDALTIRGLLGARFGFS